MTTTRKYYEALIDYFARFNETIKNQPKEYFTIKAELNNIINRIQKFNLFQLTFSKEFFDLLELDSIEDFDNDKLKISNELHFELIECLWTNRMRYGGELLQYVNKIKIALLNLNIKELKEFEKIKKIPTQYFFPEEFEFNSENEKKIRIKELKKGISEAPKKKKTKITKKDFDFLEEELINQITRYRHYVLENYPTLIDNFSFSNKMIRAYITEAMSKDIFEFRIHSYFSTSGDTSIKLIHDYYDFYPSYFYNLEEITEKQAMAYITGIQKKDFSFWSPFNISSIHRELLELFLQNSDGKSINEFTEFLLKLDGYKILKDAHSDKTGFDISAIKGKKDYLFEVFHHKNRNIAQINKRINFMKNLSPKLSFSFIFTTYPGDKILNMLKENEIMSYTFNDLTRHHFNVENSQVIHWYIKSKLSQINIKSGSTEIKNIGEGLIKRLEKCSPGTNNWSEYESIGVEIFSFLFKDNFKVYLSEEQIENDLKNHRRDLIVNNNYIDATSFWADVKSSFNCSAIIVDFKNYSKKLNSTNYFSVSKYNNKKVGNFAIIFSRKGLDDTAIIEQKALFNDGKLLIAFNDRELKEMIREKIIGKNPIDRLESKKFELIKKY